ncbi:ankyrin repeat domain-containing protein 17-like [Saccostrea cucullata]|uniref:ankyrin repeat domain-containing protein 17-like n=1 Tax=Saccostrea cuccullata TaxID=36930 RepID=UPI002ED5A565
MIACIHGHTNIIEILLEAGCDINMQNRIETPLSVVCAYGYVSVAEFLLKAGADVNLPVFYYTSKRVFTTPLREAYRSGNSKLIDTLLKWGAKEDGENKSTLNVAAECGHIKLVEDILSSEITIKNEEGYTALEMACIKGHVDVAKKLLLRFTDIADKDKIKLLEHACQGGHSKVVKELLEAGADYKPRTDNFSPLLLACLFGHREVAKELIHFGADVNLIEPYSDCHSIPFILACKSGHFNMVQDLIKLGADVNLQKGTETPMTALFQGIRCTCEGEKMEVESDTSLEIQLKDREPTEKIFSTFQQLIQCKADVTICNKYGESPIYLALLRNKKNLCKLLLETENTNARLKLNRHLFDVLVQIRQADVKADDKDDIITKSNKTWVLNTSSESYRTVCDDGCEFLNHLLIVCFNVNQYVQICFDDDLDAHYADDDAGDGNDDDFYICVKPLLFTLISIHSAEVSEKVRLLLDAGANVNIRLPQTKDTIAFNSEDCHPVLDRYGISLLEMTRRAKLTGNRLPPSACVDREKVARDYNDVMSQLKRRIRRNSF